MKNQEKRGIYNVSFNEKRATPINLEPDLLEELIESTIKEAIVMYMKGFHDYRRDKGLGAEHIKIHLEQGSEGEVSIEELLNLGNSLRAYSKKFEEPFIDKDKRKIYEWENDNGVRFRVVSDCISQKVLKKINQMGGSQLPLSPFENTIISFYSDRNFNQRMEFKNPKVKDYYENLHHLSQHNPKTTLQNIHNKLESLNQNLQIQKEQFNNAFTLKQELANTEDSKNKESKIFNKIQRR